MQQAYRILIIIPKTKSTIIAVFHNERCIFKDELFQSMQDQTISKEVSIRQQQILERLNDAGINLSRLDAVSAIGGLLRAVEGGTYTVNETMLVDLQNSYNGKHASNLGGILAHKIAAGLHLPAYIIDPPVVDELLDIARYSGFPSIERKSVFHALNQKAVARQAAQALNETYHSVNFIIAHIGNGISIAAHQSGKVIDVNNGLHGDGPFSLERAGTIPSDALINLCFSDQYSKEELIKKITYQSGLKGYLSIDNGNDLAEIINKQDKKAIEVIHAMGYQIAKEIGAMAAVLSGDVDSIVLTGEFAKLHLLTEFISERVNWIADVTIYPGEADIQALNAGTLRVLRKEEAPKEYKVRS